MTTAYIALGSNLDKPRAQLDWALRALASLKNSQLYQYSSYYRSAALLSKDNPTPQPDYLNAVAVLKTQLVPLDLLDALQALENQRGRRRDVKAWSARPLDLDILLYGDLQLDSPRLKIPHPQMYQRDFVLYPLCECEPKLILPNGQRLADLCATPAKQLSQLS